MKWPTLGNGSGFRFCGLLPKPFYWDVLVVVIVLVTILVVLVGNSHYIGSIGRYSLYGIATILLPVGFNAGLFVC